MLVKLKIPNLDQMTQIDKEAKIQKAKVGKSKAAIERRNLIRIEDEEEESSYSLMFMYSINLEKEDLDDPSESISHYYST